jgi:hypothetical protein
MEPPIHRADASRLLGPVRTRGPARLVNWLLTATKAWDIAPRRRHFLALNNGIAYTTRRNRSGPSY